MERGSPRSWAPGEMQTCFQRVTFSWALGPYREQSTIRVQITRVDKPSFRNLQSVLLAKGREKFTLWHGSWKDLRSHLGDLN